ncbi:MAG TPA: hypothetical protein VIN39_12190, partial [Candidatus Dormibacteraeota bacterium]
MPARTREAAALSRIAEERTWLARASVPWHGSEGGPVRRGSSLWPEPIGGDAAGDAQDDPAEQQRSSENAKGSLLHG